MTATSVRHTIIGLPRSGKSTFLAALHYLVDSGETATRMTLEAYSGDQSYIRGLVSAWVRCEKLKRTSVAQESHVELLLRVADSATTMCLAFPDLGGEVFEIQLAQRLCREDYVRGCSESGGLLLFVSADRPATDGMTVIQQNDALGSPATGEEAVVVVPWNHRMIPVQAQLVDLLQFTATAPFSSDRRKVAVMVSAWDVVNEPGLEPEAWLAREMPLLWQFLDSNAAQFESRIYGISAQGGSILNDGSKNELLGKVQSERIVCVGPECDANDLTIPILWLSEA